MGFDPVFTSALLRQHADHPEVNTSTLVFTGVLARMSASQALGRGFNSVWGPQIFRGSPEKCFGSFSALLQRGLPNDPVLTSALLRQHADYPEVNTSTARFTGVVG